VNALPLSVSTLPILKSAAFFSFFRNPAALLALLFGMMARYTPGAVNSHKQITATRFIGHFGQVFHIDVHEYRLEVFVALYGFDLALFDGIQCLQIDDAMRAQTRVEARARDVRIDERAYDGQQIIERQQQGPSEFDDDELFQVAHGFIAIIRRIGKVFDRIAMFLFQGRRFTNAMPGNQLTG
jgi:hypothetical protein